MALVAHLTGTNVLSDYHQAVSNLARTFKASFLELNIGQHYTCSVLRKATTITQDPTHPLHQSFQLLPSGCCYKVPLARKNVYKKSFIPTAITKLNILKPAP